MSYQVILQPRAEEDLDTILRYIHERSVAGARRWNERFEAVLESLRTNPNIYGPAPENNDHDGWFIQQVIFKTSRGNPYRVLFIVRDETVHVIYVRGFGQARAVDLDSLHLP